MTNTQYTEAQKHAQAIQAELQQAIAATRRLVADARARVAATLASVRQPKTL